ncbi:acyl-CoA dehydrogenase family protein [Novosphingobium taihuense]|uniref:Alkylation response protein AidB-like acyl-CoA dehydrogenase n=1 Tax=Novosphingobium taihuense TaxID=260085 RepID=A0A7W7AF18_9SPHN|nr:acyl-CoA dehydrogenase family protein [Novosphingobium taihuense]MBB4615060.1 alkylation response protein AidB-like acyl-CoA dehydrogenase [Novosphingobium taihuense]TWH79293.1 alkylation response protein AidB-like acyl-CoA dehydrogenase [Novosphingobium taihuense]
MDLELSDDQRMLKESVDRLVAERYDLDQRRGYMSQPAGWSAEMWSAFADLGLTMLPFSEEQGGLGLGGVETMIVGEAFGRALVIEPYLPSVVLAGTAISHAGTPDQVAEWLPPIMSGETICALATEAAVTAERTGETWILDGAAKVVLGGDTAGQLVIPAGDDLFVLPADAAGLQRRGYRVHGGGGAADLTLIGVKLPEKNRLSGNGGCTRALEAGIAWLAAEAVGAMQAALDLTVEYLKTREQFGKPIAVNQSLQHRAAEMLVEVEQARSAAMYAALLCDEHDDHVRATGYAAVKAVIGKAGRFVAQNSVQLHGGIGVSEEHVISHYFRRLTAIGMLLGDTESQITRLAELGGFTTAAPHFD